MTNAHKCTKITLVRTFQRHGTTKDRSGGVWRRYYPKSDKKIINNEAINNNVRLLDGGRHGCCCKERGDQDQVLLHHINNFIILINIVLNRITIALIKIFFDKIIIGISIIIQVELMAGGRMSLSWEFKEERLHFTLVSTYFIFHIGELTFYISHWEVHNVYNAC